MASIIARLRDRSDVHSVEPVSEGFVIHPVTGREAEFRQLVREAMNSPLGEFVILPSTRAGEYDQAHVIPLA